LTYKRINESWCGFATPTFINNNVKIIVDFHNKLITFWNLIKIKNKMIKFNIIFIPREKQKSEYDWVDILYDNCNVGKARCLIVGNELTIFSINIYPEYQGNGYGKEFIKYVKSNYRNIIADRVRFSAISFWEHVGFLKDSNTSNWIFKNQNFKTNYKFSKI